MTAYSMNPATDIVIFGDELRNGMRVLADSPLSRQPHGASADKEALAQQFRRITRLRRQPGLPAEGIPGQVIFIGIWEDGYAESHQYAETYSWIVKKDSVMTGTSRPAADPDINFTVNIRRRGFLRWKWEVQITRTGKPRAATRPPRKVS